MAVAVAFALAAAGCGGDDEPATTAAASPPPVTRPVQPVRCPAPDGRFDARRLLGLGEEAAAAMARRAGCSIRVVERDGVFQDRTDDLQMHRINVEVAGKVVVAIEGVS